MYKPSKFTCNCRKIGVKQMSSEEELEILCLEKRKNKGESDENS